VDVELGYGYYAAGALKGLCREVGPVGEIEDCFWGGGVFSEGWDIRGSDGLVEEGLELASLGGWRDIVVDGGFGLGGAAKPWRMAVFEVRHCGLCLGGLGMGGAGF
jgi:hypothetical protein